jgi:hypothetical protein
MKLSDRDKELAEKCMAIKHICQMAKENLDASKLSSASDNLNGISQKAEEILIMVKSK